MPKLTIKEIAKIARVSPSAVSIVLNNRPGVSRRNPAKNFRDCRKTSIYP